MQGGLGAPGVRRRRGCRGPGGRGARFAGSCGSLLCSCVRLLSVDTLHRSGGARQKEETNGSSVMRGLGAAAPPPSGSGTRRRGAGCRQVALRPGVRRGEAFQDGAGALLRPKDLSRATENRLLGLSSRDVTAH